MAETMKTTLPPKKKKARKKWPWIILAIIVIVIVWFVLSVQQQVASSYQSEAVQTRDISTYYSFSGNLTPVTEKTQTAKEAIKIKELYVEEGDDITAGQPLLRGTDGKRVLAQETGTIETLYVDTDDQLQAGAQIAYIVDYDTLEITVDVDEYDVGALTLGKQGTVYINALSRSVMGTVSKISRNATTEGGVSYYQVKMEIEATEDIRSGMSVEVNVLDKEALSVPSISVKTLSYDEYNKPFVLVQDAEGRTSMQYVQLGVSDSLYTEITEGLSNGQTIYYIQNDTMRFFMMRQNMANSRN